MRSADQMRNRAFLLACFCASCLLTACSGGGSSPSAASTPASATPTPRATATPTPKVTLSPTPAPTPTPVPSDYPYANGNTFAYAGTLAQSFQSFPEIQPPGTPSPEPIATTVTTVTQSVSVTTSQTFNGTSGLIDLHDAETDALSSGLETTTSTTDTFVQSATSGAATQLLGFGSHYVDEGGDTTSTLPNPATILDELPETAGATWTNGPGATIDEALAGDAAGSAITVVRAVNNDGTYTEKTTYPPNYSGEGISGVGTVQENSDGSGSLTIAANGGYTTVVYSQPVPQASGSPLVSIDVYPSQDATGNPEVADQLPSFYGLTPALYAESDADDGVTAVPPACGLAVGLPKEATALVQTIARTDTILGYTETTTTANYIAPGYGLICATLADKETAYYDFNGDEPFTYTMTPPLEITTTTETLGLQPGSTIAQSASARRTATAHSSYTPLAIALRARFDRTVRAARAKRLATLVHRLEARRFHGDLR
jgi:hypothetical protein